MAWMKSHLVTKIHCDCGYYNRWQKWAIFKGRLVIPAFDLDGRICLKFLIDTLTFECCGCFVGSSNSEVSILFDSCLIAGIDPRLKSCGQGFPVWLGNNIIRGLGWHHWIIQCYWVMVALKGSDPRKKRKRGGATSASGNMLWKVSEGKEIMRWRFVSQEWPSWVQSVLLLRKVTVMALVTMVTCTRWWAVGPLKARVEKERVQLVQWRSTMGTKGNKLGHCNKSNLWTFGGVADVTGPEVSSVGWRRRGTVWGKVEVWRFYGDDLQKIHVVFLLSASFPFLDLIMNWGGGADGGGKREGLEKRRRAAIVGLI